MAQVICNMECKNRSKRPSRKWKMKNGAKAYGCKLGAIIVGRIFDPDGDCVKTIGESCMAQCKHYEPIISEVADSE